MKQILILLTTLLVISCSKDNNNNPQDNKITIKYKVENGDVNGLAMVRIPTDKEGIYTTTSVGNGATINYEHQMDKSFVYEFTYKTNKPIKDLKMSVDVDGKVIEKYEESSVSNTVFIYTIKR